MSGFEEHEKAGTEGDPQEPEERRDPARTPADDPSEGPGPRGNQELDPDRVEKVREDMDRTGN